MSDESRFLSSDIFFELILPTEILLGGNFCQQNVHCSAERFFKLDFSVVKEVLCQLSLPAERFSLPASSFYFTAFRQWYVIGKSFCLQVLLDIAEIEAFL